MKYRKGYKYQIAEDYTIPTEILNEHIVSGFIILEPTGLLHILRGYAWDGPSGPTLDTKTFMRGSLVHDVLYQLMREERLKKEIKIYADDLLKEICLEDGMCSFRAWYVHRGVSRCAGFAADPKNKKKVYEAP